MIDTNRINNTMGKFLYHIETHKSIAVSVSGGADSTIIVHMVATYFREYLPKIHFIYVNTGLEYRATRDFIKYLEERYDIKIEQIRGVSVVNAVHQYGVPMVSKDFSFVVEWYLKGRPWAIERVEGLRNSKYDFNAKKRNMAHAIKDRGIKVSNNCCNVSKKKPLFKRYRELDIDLNITGERQAEGGIRATQYSDCFQAAHKHHWDKYMPLYYWNDETKAFYKEQEGIRYSDCYEVWGMDRTGCVGCPYNSRLGRDLEMIKKHEPLMYKACLNVFGTAYQMQDEFEINRNPILKRQISMFDGESR